MKNFKHIIHWSMLMMLSMAALSFHGTLTAYAQSEDQPTLIFLTWYDYIDAEVVQAFEEQYQVKIKEVNFESDDMRHEMLFLSEGKGYDLVLLSNNRMNTYIKQGWLAKLDQARIPNLKQINPRWAELLPQAVEYGVPYTWGTVGIAYRKDLVTEPITSWKQLFQPKEELRGKIFMSNDAEDLIGTALKTLGYSANTTDRKELAEAEQLLLAQKPYVKDYSFLTFSEDSGLVTGDIWMAMVYSGDVPFLQQYHPDLVYVVPQEGTILWVDYLTIPQQSEQKGLAIDFINFLNEPENAAKISLYLKYATPNKAAQALLPPEHLNNPDIYPDATTFAHSELFQELPIRIVKYRNTIFSKIVN